jgi:secreted trypsin-like serine protease
MTVIISTGVVTFQNFTCLVFQGDSGGPLVYLESDAVYTQVGIVTLDIWFGWWDCHSHAVFTRVNAYLCWIAAHSDITFCFCK